MMPKAFILLLALIPVSLICLPYAWAQEDRSSATDRIRYLLLDTRVVESTENATLAVGTAEKYAGNPLFEEDKPWEKRFDNLYANVMFDKEEGI